MNASVVSSPGLHRVVEGTFEATYERVRTALKAADFEILAEINLAEFVAKKSQSYVRPCKIFVVCNADNARHALTVTPEADAMLLSHVAVSQMQDDWIEVRVTDPHIAWNTASNVYLKPVAEELRTHLERVITALNA